VNPSVPFGVVWPGYPRLSVMPSRKFESVAFTMKEPSDGLRGEVGVS
jgi:hypothetical protein